MLSKVNFKYFFLYTIIISLSITFSITYLIRSNKNLEQSYKIIFKNFCDLKNYQNLLKKIDNNQLDKYFYVYNSNLYCKNKKNKNVTKVVINKKKNRIFIINQNFLLGHLNGELKKTINYKIITNNRNDLKTLGMNYNNYDLILNFKLNQSIRIHHLGKGEIIKNSIYPIIFLLFFIIFYLTLLIFLCFYKLYETFYNKLLSSKQP